MIRLPSNTSGINEVPQYVLPVVPLISVTLEEAEFDVRSVGGISGPCKERDSLLSVSLHPSGSP